MEIGLIFIVLLVQVAGMWFLGLESVKRHRKTQESLYKTEVLTSELGKLVQDLTISLDSAKSIMSDVAQMEERLVKKDDSRETQRRLLEMREGGWRGV